MRFFQFYKYFFKKHFKTVRFCFINATISLIILFITQTIYLFPTMDSKSLLLGPILKNYIFSKKEIVKPEDVLFINTSFENQLVDNLDSSGAPNGNISITDRNKLKTLFSRINDSVGYKYIICDIFLENDSPHDSELNKALLNKPKYIFPRKDSINLTANIFRELNFGLGSIYKANGVFYKYKLVNNGIKSLPLKMYEDISGIKSRKFLLWNILGKKVVPNDYIPNLIIRNYHLFETEKYKVHNLGDLVSISENNLINYYKDKIIVIGNFDTDTHNTIFGKTQGSLILLNIYLSLEYGYNKITIVLFFFLFFTFFIISFLIRTPQEKIVQFLLQFKILGAILLGVSFVLAVTFLSVLIFFLFDVNLIFSYLGMFFFLENVYLHRDFYLNKIKINFLNIKK